MGESFVAGCTCFVATISTFGRHIGHFYSFSLLQSQRLQDQVCAFMARK